ncbi:LppU/SCO3897 family protein [Streptomyces sp.]|uniref:LppU/SCO3897 family protein n=1 Tax=Streptomyces sp. TaxID=1931 RepID=UPI002F3EC765
MTTEPTPAVTPALGNKSFAKGSCVADDPLASEDSAFLAVVPCTDPAAFAKVLEREAFDATKASKCPKEAAKADKLVQLSRPGQGKDAGQVQYAPVCLRNLRAPHPGDPGQGGGPNIVKGDCLVEKRSYRLPTTGSGTSTFETACAGTGADAPGYRVIALGTATILRGDKGIPCPRTTQVEFRTEDEAFMGTIYCAVRL